jgi:hypothetical protein
MNNSPPIPPLVSIPPEGYGAAFDYDYWRWYFFSLDNNDYMWVLSQNEWLAVNRILAFRTDEVWSFADSPDQSAFTEYITWLIEMNILTDETAHTIANISYDNPTMYPQGRTMMGFYPPPKPYYQTQEDPVNEKIPENNSNWDNCGVIGEKLDDWKTAETYTGWEFNTPLKTPKQETPPAPKKVKKYKSPLSRPEPSYSHSDENPRAVDDPYWKVGGWEAAHSQSLPPNYVSSEATNWEYPETPSPRKNLEQSIADMLDYETISNTTSSQ